MRPSVTILCPSHPARHQLLVDRCISSVIAQTRTDWEMLILDDEDVRAPRWIDPRITYYAAPPTTWKDVGAWKLKHGLALATCERVAYICDDDEWLPDHLETHLAYDVDFSISRVAMFFNGTLGYTVGGSFDFCHLDTNGIVHQRRLRELGTWRNTGSWNSDWDVVTQWRQAGADGILIDKVTARHHK